ncbi:hypothetical protein AAG906_027687 [Vitis piasezkii]
MEEVISGILTDLEAHSTASLSDPNPPLPVSQSTLSDLQTLLDNAIATEDSHRIDRLFEDLSSRNLSISSLIRPMASAMDSSPTHISLLASRVYLSLLLSLNAPVFTLFTPMAFLSLLRSIRQCFKNRKMGPPRFGESSRGLYAAAYRKRKGGGRARGVRSRVREVDDGDGSEESEFDVRMLFSVLERLQLVLGLIHLDRFPDSLKSLVQTVAEIPAMALELCGNTTSFDKLTHLCSQVLTEVLSSEHGDQATTAAEVLKSLSPLILLAKSEARTFALGFVMNRMMGMAKEFDGVKKAIVNLPRYLLQKAPEKSEPRALVVESVMEIVKTMEFEEQIGFVKYVVKMTQGKSHFRLLAGPIGVNTGNEVKNSWGLNCLEALIQRCSDATAGIRARALTNLAQIVGFLSTDDRNQVMLKEVMGFGSASHQKLEGGMNDLLRKRCMDEKAAVRKAALLLITKLTGLLGGEFVGDLLKTMGMACSDPLVSIRKAAISALSEAFKTFPDGNVTTEWLHSIPRLITDNESSIQEECENLFLELVLDRVSRAGSTVSAHKKLVCNDLNAKTKSLEMEIELLFPGGVLVLLKEICNGEVAPWVKKICTSLGKKKRLKPKIAVALQGMIKASESLWLSHSMPIEKWTALLGPGFFYQRCQSSSQKQWTGSSSIIIGSSLTRMEQGLNLGIASCPILLLGLEIVFSIENNFQCFCGTAPEPAAALGHNLLTRIEEFNMHSTEVNAHVKALRTLCKRQVLNPDEADDLVQKCVHKLLSKASQILDKYISEASEANIDSDFRTPPGGARRKGRTALTMSRSLSRAITAVYTIGSLVIICPSANLDAIIPILHTIITSGSSDTKLNKLQGNTFPLKQAAPSLYIHAWVTMGKICLADGELAKRYIPLFVQELEKSDCAALRNNIVVTLADFCVRYTALVDCYVSKITKCLRDSCELVRRQTFILLSRLLQRDYVKWRGVLFLRFLLSLVDESEEIRRLADFLFGNILKAKAPLLAYNSFVEAIFVLNDCHVHNGGNDSQSTQTERDRFSIRGNDEKSRSKRMHIYVCLLKQMAPEHLLATFAKLCAEILAAASDGMLNMEDVHGQSVLQDTFRILACKEIRIPSTRGSTSDSADGEEEGLDGGAASAASAARGRAITQAVKKSLVQNTIPIFIELKRLLESKNSPLTGSLMECLRILLKDYKNEIDDMLVADKQLQKELIYDMEKYDAAKAKSTAAAAVATMQPCYRSPHVSKFTERLPVHSRVASAMSDAVAAATVRSVLKEVNRGSPTPPFTSIGRPKLKSSMGGTTSSRGDRPLDVIESLRRRQSFNSDEENC